MDIHKDMRYPLFFLTDQLALIEDAKRRCLMNDNRVDYDYIVENKEKPIKFAIRLLELLL